MRLMLTILISMTTLSVSAQQPLKFNVIVQRESAAVADVSRTRKASPAADTASDLLKQRGEVINRNGGKRLRDKEFYLCFYSASWCTFCHAFEASEEYARIKAVYGVTTVDWDTCPREWKTGLNRIPGIQLRRVSDRKLIRQWIGRVTLEQIDDARHTPPANPIPVNNGVTQRELIQMHDRLHNQESGLNATWTWSGDLKTHLRTVHGVAL